MTKGRRLSVQEIIKWYDAASGDDRQALLLGLRAYPVSQETWYIHPFDRLPPVDPCQVEIGEYAEALKQFDLPEPGFINEWVI